VSLDSTPPSHRFWPWSLVWAVLFAVAHTQSPHYFSNQHQYLLHGLADAGFGLLDQDWLANTKDPTPVFSDLVAKAYAWVGPFAFQALYFVLLGVYFESVRRLVEVVPGFPSRGPARIVFLTLFLAVHAAILRVWSVELTGVDYPWYLQLGVAGQYVLGPGLQPSAFGMLLVASLAGFANGRSVLAAALAAGAAVVHSTYLLPAGLMTLGYVLVLFRERQVVRGLAAGLLALALVIPVVAYNLRNFSPVDPDRFREAERLLAEVRIPHHAAVDRWLDVIAVAQLGAMLVGIVLVRRTRLFPVLVLVTAACVILTVVQVMTGSHTLALLFPWRFSAVLMPVATAVILAHVARGIARLARSEPAGRAMVWVCGAVAVGLAAGGVAVMALGLGYGMNDAELSLLDFVEENKRPGDVYLLPVRFPNLRGARRGSASTTFTPPPRAKPGVTLIPVDLQRFRLSTGAPIYVDFKAVPYAEDDVLEWHRRMQDCERWYDRREWGDDIIREVRAAGITHVVATADRDVTSPALELIYHDEAYRLYRVRPVQEAK
jgi:Domain of unknown function (DUF6798)